MFKRINGHQKTIEWFGYMAAGFCSMAVTAIEQGNAAEAAWATASAERFRALAIFKANFEEAVFMGHSARRLVELLQIWDANKENSDEEFWQIKLGEHAYAISQLFSVPVTLIQGKAYVGGMSMDRQDARFLDFMFSGGSAKQHNSCRDQGADNPAPRRQVSQERVSAQQGPRRGSRPDQRLLSYVARTFTRRRRPGWS